jgi:hypothetical protein
LIEYVESYGGENKLDVEECSMLTTFLKDSLDKKKLSRVKDVIYDKITGAVKDIPALVYNKSNKHFTLKNMDNKRVSTLKSLAPKKVNGTVRNKQLKVKPETTDSASDDEN